MCTTCFMLCSWCWHVSHIRARPVKTMGVLQGANAAAASLALMLYRDEVRRLLMRFTGYECAVSSLSYLKGCGNTT